MSDPEEQSRRKEFDTHYKKFFELIGHCVTLYQTVEDHLEDVFVAALGGDENRASAMFAVVRGLEGKLDIISAALTGRGDDLAQYWPNLLSRVKNAADARHKIAHGRPLMRAGKMTVVIDPETDTLHVERTEKDRMELRKRMKKGDSTRLLEDLFDEYRRNEKLCQNLIGFVKLLQGVQSPEHLLEGLTG